MLNSITSRDSGKWVLSGSVKAHEGAVLRVSKFALIKHLVWADPVFGPLLVTWSTDKTVRFITEETNGLGLPSKWNVVNTLTKLRELSDIKFAPKRFGFKLAACTKDSPGELIVFAPGSKAEVDSCDIKAQAIVSNYGWNWLSWDPDGQENNELIVVGSEAESSDNINIESTLNSTHKFEESGNDELRIFSFSGAKLTPVINLTSEKGHNSLVKDVAWAPLCGRAYHKIGNIKS